MRREKVLMWLVWHLPRVVVYFCAIRVWAWGTTGRYGDTEVTQLTVDEALRRYRTMPERSRLKQ